MPAFKFNLGDQAKIIASSETGKIVGRAESANTENTYSLHYQCADGRAVTAWWDESFLQAVNATPDDTSSRTRDDTADPQPATDHKSDRERILLSSLSAILLEVCESPEVKPYSSESYLPDHLIADAFLALQPYGCPA